MFKLVVLIALLAIAAAKPSGWEAIAPVVETYSLPVVAAVPSAVSHSYRKDVISEPVVATYSAPAVIATPVVQKVIAPVAVPAAVSYSHRSDVISKPVLAAYSAPVLSYSAHLPAVHAW